MLKKIILFIPIFFSHFCFSINYIETADMSFDGRLAIGFSHGKLHVIDFHSNKLLLSLNAHNDQVSSLNFSHDGEKILSLAEKEVKIWNSRSGALLSFWQINAPYTLRNVCFAPKDDQVLVSGYNIVSVFDLEGEELFSLPEHGTAKAIYSHSGDKIGIADFNANRIAIYGKGTRAIEWSATLYWPSHIAFNKDDSHIAVANGLRVKTYNLFIEKKREINDDFEFNHSENEFHDYDNWLLWVSYNTAGNKIITFDNKGCLFLLDLATKKTKAIKNLGSIKYSNFNPDENEIIIVTHDKMLIYDGDAQKKIRESTLLKD